MELLIIKFQRYSLLMGGCCGVFVQLPTLGANFHLVPLWGEEVIVVHTRFSSSLLPLLTKSFSKTVVSFAALGSFFGGADCR